jgi:DNA polymerase subunit Cdc27
MSAFANAPPKRREVKEEGGAIVTALTTAKPGSPEPTARISAKRQAELDKVNRMMEDEEPEGSHSLAMLIQNWKISLSRKKKAQLPLKTVRTPKWPIPQLQWNPRPRPQVNRRNENAENEKYLRKRPSGTRKDIWVVLLSKVLTIVTKNEYVYESFSEDEESDVLVEKKSGREAPVKSNGKGKKDVAGQKSLMSFFGKK